MKRIFLSDKVSYSKKPFKLRVDNITLQGSLEKKDYHKVELDGELSGELELICYRCGEQFYKPLKSPLTLTLTDRVVEISDDLDIIEFLDGVIDLDFILNSEVSSISELLQFMFQLVKVENRRGLDQEVLNFTIKGLVIGPGTLKETKLGKGRGGQARRKEHTY